MAPVPAPWTYRLFCRRAKLSERESFTAALGAQAKARELQRLIDEGKDPRELKRGALAAQAEKKAAAAAAQLRAAAHALTVGEVWTTYIAERRPFWGDLHYRDHLDKAKSGGEPSKRRGAKKDAKTQPGPLAALMPLALKDLDQATIERWAANESPGHHPPALHGDC